MTKKRKDAELATQIVMAGATGKLDTDAMGAMLSVLGGAPLLRPTVDPVTGTQEIHESLDANGQVLVAGGVYLLDGKRVKVLREAFGAGNALDTYYRVFYLDQEFRERFIVADARGSVFGKRTYSTRLTPAPRD